MKKTLFSLLSATALLWSASCSDDAIVSHAGGDTLVQFNVELADGSSASRAISDGSSVNHLYYEVYSVVDGERTLLPDLDNGGNPMTITNGKANVQFALVKGQSYDIVFWAQKDGAYVADDLQNIQVGKLANNDDLDAFTYVHHIASVEGAKSETVYLTRPFAQVNFGTTDADIDAAKSAGVVFNQASGYITQNRLASQITVTDAALSYNALTKLSNESADQCNSVVFAWNKIPSFDEKLLEVGEGENKVVYRYLATAYVLVPEADQATADLKMEIETGLNNDIIVKVPFAPIRRNYRTNVLGNLLTNQTDFTVVVDADFNPDREDHIIEVWDGVTKEEVEPKTETNENGEEVTVYEVTSGAQLAWLAELVNGGGLSRAGLTKYNIELTSNIDLGNNPWTPIGTEANPFSGSFNGNGYGVNHLNIVEKEAKNGKAYIGFFGYTKDVTIKDVAIEDVTIDIACLDIDHSQGHIGALVGSLEGSSTIENVIVSGDIKVSATFEANGASRVAVVAGGNSYGDVTMKNVHVIANEGSFLKANNNIGALAGQLQGKSIFENCSSNIDVTAYKFFAGGIIGLASGDQTFTNCHTTGDVKVVAGRAGRANDQYRVGGIAGGWADGKNKVCKLTNCSYLGKVSGVNADGSVASPLDYAGYVGRGYTLANCAGSKVVIDGDEYVQAYDDVYGLYIVNDVYEIGSTAALKSFAAKVNAGDTFVGKTVKLTANLDLKNEQWMPIGTIDNNFEGNFDGNGQTVKNLNISEPALDSDGYAYAGLFGVTAGSDVEPNYIKNLVIENVNISTTGHIVAAAVAYPYYTTIEDVTVKGNVNIKGGDYTAGILAYTRRCVDAKNLAIKANTGSVIEGRYTVGGVISDIQMNGGLTANYSNFEASGLTIKATKNVGGISGIITKQTLNGATVKNVNIVCDDERKGIVSGANGGKSTINNVSYENVTGATRIIGATYDKGYYEGQIVDVAGVKAIVYSIADGAMAVSVEELNLKGKSAVDAATWAQGLGEGWNLASIYELDAIHAARKALNVALAADNADNALFCETDYISEGKYAMYISSTVAEGNDPQGQAYFANRVHVKYFNLNGYWDYPYSSFATINKSAPLKDNYFARGVIAL